MSETTNRSNDGKRDVSELKRIHVCPPPLSSSSSDPSVSLVMPEEVEEPPKKLSSWERGFRSLAAFHKKHGHTNVPYRYEEDRTLGTWTARQRKLKEELKEDQRQRLEALGFVWQSSQDRAWMEKFERLKAYFDRKGSSCVPTSYPEDPELGEWTAKQRQKATQGRLSEERRALLDSVDFVYRINKFVKRKSTAREDKKWWEQLERLIHFLLEHGHTLVPFQYFADKSLGRWVNEQRCQNMRGLLREDRKEILSNIGFVWKVHSRKGQWILAPDADDNTQWAYSFRQLVEYKNTTGVFPGDTGTTTLDCWAEEQRQLMHAGELEEMKAHRLAAIGFCDFGDDEVWDSNYAKLEQHGYNSIYTLEDPCLTHWVIVVNYLHKKGRLSQERKMQLFDIPGFVWDSAPLNLPKPESRHGSKKKGNRKGSVGGTNYDKENTEPAVRGNVKTTPLAVTSSTPLQDSLNGAPTPSTSTSFGSAILERSKPLKKRVPSMTGPTAEAAAASNPAMQSNEIEGFCGLLAIASSFRAKEI